MQTKNNSKAYESFFVYRTFAYTESKSPDFGAKSDPQGASQRFCSPSESSDLSGRLNKDDLRAFGHVYEVAGSDNFTDTRQEIFILDAKHIHGHLTAVHLGAAI